MRRLASIGLLISLTLAAVALLDTAESVSTRRNFQDRAVQAAVAAETGRLLGSQRQMSTAAAQMLANPAVRALLSPAPLPAAARRADRRDAVDALDTFERLAIVPVSSACIADAAGRQLACASGLAPTVFPLALGDRFATLAAETGGGGATRTFLSPLSGRPTAAYVSPLRLGGRLRGLVHFDIADENPNLIVHTVPGVRVQLGAYEDGMLLLGAGGRQLAHDVARSPGATPFATAPQWWWSFVAGHRTVVAPLPMPIGDPHRELAIVATEAAVAPRLLNSFSPVMVALLGLALALLGGSLALLIGDGRRLRRELATDQLTGLGSRRALLEDLARACQRASEDSPAFLWLFDLDGFKAYNDSFGHGAGDVLLRRLGQRLRAAIGPDGGVYRLGGDEFCALIQRPAENPMALFERARQALSERGGAFTVTCSAGAVEIPREAAEETAALRLADQHMYRDKAVHRGGAAAELVTAVLHAALAQRHPELDEHSSDVAEDVELLARTLGLTDEEVAMVVRAGDLHDVGKLGIPDEIITRAGPLSEREWDFMRQHTVMGERIIAAAGPSLERIAPLVRASHERWDGAGYPDGLAGEQIPLGARIITICDSYRAMLAERPYKRAMTQADALAELRRCAGTQFDPRLVATFCALIEARAVAARPLPPG